MKTENIAKIFILAVVFGMGIGIYFTMPAIPDIPEEPNPAGLTAKGLQVKADVAERQARGFVQYTGTIVPGTADAFYEGLGYDINIYKSA